MKNLLASQGRKCGAAPLSAQSEAPAKPLEGITIHSQHDRIETELVG